MRIKAGLYILSIILFISGCTSEEKSTAGNNIPPYTKTSDDIIDKFNHIENQERFEKFINNV